MEPRLRCREGVIIERVSFADSFKCYSSTFSSIHGRVTTSLVLLSRMGLFLISRQVGAAAEPVSLRAERCTKSPSSSSVLIRAESL